MSTSAHVEHIPAFLRRMPAAFPGGVAYLNRELVVTYCNDVQASYFGLSPDGVVGKSLTELAPEVLQICGEVRAIFETKQADSQTPFTVLWPEREGEDQHSYLVSYVQDITRAGRVRGLFMTSLEVPRPVDKQPKAERDLLELIRTLEKRLREKDLLVGIISHELRAPLTTIYGNAHMLLRRLEDMDEDSRTSAISDIRTEAERLSRLVENMLLLARDGADEPVSTEPMLVAKAIGEVIEEHGKRFPDRTLVGSVKPRGLMAEAQPEYLKQVLQNLLGNAEKYSPPEQQIDVRVRCSGPEMRFRVFDRGQGVDPAEAEIIFQPFFRSARTARAVGGAGIGLAVCKLLVQAQSGRIGTRPRRGGGSVFEFTLPAVA